MFLLLLTIAVIGLTIAVAVSAVDVSLPPAVTDRPYVPLPTSGIVPDDVAALRFTVAVRGYRMDEVDETIARLNAELAHRDQLIAQMQFPPPTTPAL